MSKTIEELENEILRLNIIRPKLVETLAADELELELGILDPIILQLMGELQHVKIMQMTSEKIKEYEAEDESLFDELVRHKSQNNQ